MPVAVQHYDRQLERHELPHGHQGLPRHPVQLCGCHWRGVPVRPDRAGAGAAAGRGPFGVNCSGLRRHARLGRGTAVPVFSSERPQPLALFAVARSVYAAGAHGPVNQSGTLCAPGDYLGRSYWRAGQGLVLWCALLRCAGAHRVFDDPGHDRQLCGLGRGQLLSALPRLLQPVQRRRRGRRHCGGRGGDALHAQQRTALLCAQAAVCDGGGHLARDHGAVGPTVGL